MKKLILFIFTILSVVNVNATGYEQYDDADATSGYSIDADDMLIDHLVIDEVVVMLTENGYVHMVYTYPNGDVTSIYKVFVEESASSLSHDTFTDRLLINDETLYQLNYSVDSIIENLKYKRNVKVDITNLDSYFTITYDVDGANYKEVVAGGDSPVNIPNTIKEGFKFDGWNDGSITHNNLSLYTVSKDVTFTAVYSIITYTLSYRDWNSTVLVQESLEFNSEESTSITPVPERDGYSFKDWVDSKGNVVDLSNFVMPSNNVSLYATYVINSYNLTYINDDLSGLGNELVTFNTIPTSIPSVSNKVGYLFNGWVISPYTIGDKVYRTDLSDFRMLGTDVTLVAHYLGIERELTYSVEGNTYIETVRNGDSPIEIPDTSQVGKTFTHWIDTMGNTYTDLLNYKMPDNNETLTAVYTYDNYTLSFKDALGNVDVDSSILVGVDQSPEINAIPIYTKENYSHTNWKYGLNIYEVDLSNFKMPLSDVTLSPVFTIDTYKVTFDIIGEITEKDINYNSLISSTPNTVIDGLKFIGWRDDLGNIIDLSTYKVTNNINLKAVYTATATFIVDGVAYDSEVEIGTKPVDIPTYSEEGYSLSHWIYQTETLSNDLSGFLMPDSDVTLVAEIEKNEYNLNFNILGNIITVGTKYNELPPTIVNPEVEGRTFNFWTDGSINYDVLLTDFSMPANDITLTADYTINNYTLTFLDDGQIGSYSVEFQNKPTTIPSPSPKEGYIFIGWSDGTTSYEKDLSDFLMPSSNIDLTAEYTFKNYKLTYFDETELASEVIKYKSVANSIPTPTKEGFTHIGWSDSINTYSLDLNEFTMPAKDTTLTAIYDINKYILTYSDYNDNIISSEEIEFNAMTLNTPNPYRSGYNFTGWSDGTTNYSKDLSDFKMGSSDITLKAIYSRSSSSSRRSSSSSSSSSSGGGAPTITLNGDGQISVEYNTQYIEPGFIAIDYVGATDITDKVVISGDTVDINTLGTYWITYTVEGSITSASTRRRVDVVDSTPPVIEFNDGETVEVEIDTEYVDPGFTVTDNYDKTLTVDDVIVEGNVDTSKISTQTITYTVTDSHYNKVTYTKTINVVLDLTPPVLELKGNEVEYVELGTSYNEKGIDITDKFKTTTKINGEIDVNKLGTYEIEYIVTDESGNKSTITRIVKVIEPINKTINININDGFDEIDMTISSIKFKLEGTTTKYILRDKDTKPSIYDPEWRNFSNSLDLEVYDAGWFLHVLLLDTDGQYEVFTSNELPYEATTSLVDVTEEVNDKDSGISDDTDKKMNKVVIKSNGKDNKDKVKEAIEEKEVFTKEIVKVQPKDDGTTLVVFDLREQAEYKEVKVYYRDKQSSTTTLMINVNASDGWEELIVKEGEVESITVSENQELEFKTELSYKDGTKETQVSEFKVALNEGEVTIDVVSDTSYALLYIVILLVIIISTTLYFFKFKKVKA